MPEIVVSKMTSKNQITVPARVRDILCLRGATLSCSRSGTTAA